jgi:two-component system OmpR family sensor kinase
VSLRARLVAGLLALSALGLVLLAGITYAEQRSFLLDRVNEQARSAIPLVNREAYRQAAGGDAPRDRLQPPVDRFRPPGGRPDGPERGLPAGAFGQIRDTSGAVQATVTLGLGRSTSTGELPARLPLGRTVSVESDGRRYRVLAEATAPGLVTVAAIPLDDVDDTLSRLLRGEALVGGGDRVASA